MSKPKHNHTPWLVYEKTLTTSGHSIEFVREIMDGLKTSSLALNCPACKKEKTDAE